MSSISLSGRVKLASGTRKLTLKNLLQQRQLIWMSLPLILYIILMTYAPLMGWIMAFQDYNPANGMPVFSEQTWVGFKWFEYLFQDETFPMVLRNTLAMSFINLIFGYVTAIVLALLLNEVRQMFFKRAVQTISYLPHFLSMVIVSGLVMNMLAADGAINNVLMALGVIQDPILFLGEQDYFWWIVGVTNVWKEVGWSTIIYLAAIASIDPNLYEAAEIDGCNRYHKMWHITLPGIKPTIVVLMIMSIGNILNAGFELQYLLRNGLISDVSDTIDVFVYVYGFSQNNYSMATAAGMFKSVVSIILLTGANFVAKRLGQERLI